jgi:uncharacterized protein YceH (UPF0502 family)
MYKDCTNARRCERHENAKFVKELRDDKNKVESKYSSLIADVNKHMDETAWRIIQQNHARIMGNNEEGKSEVDVLKNEVAMLKEEMEKHKCVICDLLNAGAANSDKLRRMKAIYDE